MPSMGNDNEGWKMNQQEEANGADNPMERFLKIIDLSGYTTRAYSIAALVIGVLLIFAGVVTSDDHTPPTWLTEWTDWAINYIALVVAAGAAVGVTKAAIDKLNRP